MLHTHHCHRLSLVYLDYLKTVVFCNVVPSSLPDYTTFQRSLPPPSSGRRVREKIAKKGPSLPLRIGYLFLFPRDLYFIYFILYCILFYFFSQFVLSYLRSIYYIFCFHVSRFPSSLWLSRGSPFPSGFLTLPTLTLISPLLVRPGLCLVQPSHISTPTSPLATYSSPWWWRQ
jgi:hypothetical protein